MKSSTYRDSVLLIVFVVLSTFGIGEVLVRVASLISTDVDYLASADFKGRPNRYKDLDSFISGQKHLIPYRNWANYFTNKLGFNDLEFEPSNPPARFRVMALGDSFCYGMIPYPSNVQTLVEKQLNTDCGQEIEIMNFGLPGAHTWKYKVLFQLARPIFRPDLVVIHFYMGNDGPDLVRHKTGLPVIANPFWSSHLFSFVRNSLKLLTGLESAPGSGTAARKQVNRKNRPAASGGQKIDPNLPDPTDQSPSFSQPRFTVPAFAKQRSDELVRFYRSGPEMTERDWAPVLANLEAIRKTAQEHGSEAALVLYPSALQVYPGLMAETVADILAGRPLAGFDPDRVDSFAPNRVLLNYARRNNLPCLDLTPSLIQAAKGSPEPLYLNRDTHWNFRGNRVAAFQEAVFLRKAICP